MSGLGDVADGVLWPDGTAAVRWRGEHPSTVHQGATEVVFVDQGDEQPAAAAGPGTVPLVLRRIVEHALRRPVPCPKCARLTPCRCIADRTEGRLDVVLDAVALWLAGSAAA